MVNCLGTRRCGGMVDTRDLKSLGRKTVPVRVGSPAPSRASLLGRSAFWYRWSHTRSSGSISERPNL